MPEFRQRPFHGIEDLRRMAELVRRYPEDHLHVIDLPYRLASWSLDDPRNVRIWEDEHGALLGWAALQLPWSALDTGVSPGTAGLEREMFEWADSRAQAVADEGRQEFMLCPGVLAGRPGALSWLTDHGFAPTEWQTLNLARSLADEVSIPRLPDGFALRPLRGAAEAADYVALHRAAFGSTHMTVEWRARTLTMPHYTPELDLVMTAPDGRLAAFCIGWALPDHTEAQIEPLGVHPEFQQLGLGRAILLDALRRMRALGAGLARVDVYSVNDPGRGLYESAGFRAVRTPITYGKTYFSG